MKTATITDAKNGLSALIDEVKSGETVVILDRGIPVATVEPIAKMDDPTGRIARLYRAGIVRPPQSAPPLHLLDEPLPRTVDGASVVEAVLEERRTGW